MSPALPPAAAAQLAQAIAFHKNGALDQAEPLYRQVLAAHPTNFDALHLLGVLASDAGFYEPSVHLITQALAIEPQHPAAYYNRGSALLALQRPADAIPDFDRALALRPDYVNAIKNRAVAMMALSQPAPALAGFERALALKPDDPEILANITAALLALKQPGEALARIDHALALAPDNPFALYNRANIKRDLGQFDGALADYEHAVALTPHYPEAWTNRGLVLTDLRRTDEARASYARARAIDPAFPAARLNEGIGRLLTGDYPAGWDLYEARWQNEPLIHFNRSFDAPQWNGQDIAGKTLLVHAEQGLGDTLQFCRYVPMVAALGAKVVFEVQAPLLPLLARLEGAHQVIAHGAPLPAFDLHCPLLSLPRAFGTTRDTIPAPAPYLYPAPALTEKWRAKIAPLAGLRIGLVWSGAQALKNDANRSIPLAALAPLFEQKASWISLQKDVRLVDQPWLAAHPEIHHFGDALHDFDDTAALTGLMDLVISVDTAVAHLAGALGRPLWLLLPHIGIDWRWMLEGNDSPWYPTARLFRQPAAGDWRSVVPTIAQAAGIAIARGQMK